MSNILFVCKCCHSVRLVSLVLLLLLVLFTTLLESRPFRPRARHTSSQKRRLLQQRSSRDSTLNSATYFEDLEVYDTETNYSQWTCFEASELRDIMSRFNMSHILDASESIGSDIRIVNEDWSPASLAAFIIQREILGVHNASMASYYDDAFEVISDDYEDYDAATQGSTAYVHLELYLHDFSDDTWMRYTHSKLGQGNTA